MPVTDLEIVRAAKLLREGGLVAFPTETVYGLGANALDPDAVARIFEVKGRPPSSPLIVHVDSVAMAQSLVAEWPAQADALAARFWPGPLTMVLPKLAIVPDEVTAGLPTVGIRMPDHPLALRLIHEAGVPVAAPSANKFTHLSPTTADHVRSSLGDEVDMILNGGPTQIGIESTVVSISGGVQELLRPGMITREEIEDCIGALELAQGGSGPHASPGMHHKHYSPRTPLVLGNPPAGRAAFLWWSAPGVAARQVQMPGNPKAYAAALYRILHELDREEWDAIGVELPPDTPEWAGIRDRLRRAANR